MDITFREDAPIQLHHDLCSGTEARVTAQDAMNANNTTIVTLREELADDHCNRPEEEVNADIGVLEADNIVHQSDFNEELSRVRQVSDYLTYVLAHSSETASERRLHQNEDDFESWKLLGLRYSGGRRLGTYSLPQNTLVPCWTGQHQHHQFRTWMEHIAKYESESGMVINDHLKIATAMNHLRESFREHLLINSKPLTTMRGHQVVPRQLLLQELHPASIMTRHRQHGAAKGHQPHHEERKRSKGKGKGKGKPPPSSSFPKGNGKKTTTKGTTTAKVKVKVSTTTTTIGTARATTTTTTGANNGRQDGTTTTTATTTRTKGSPKVTSATRIVDSGVDCRDPLCRHRFRFPEEIFAGTNLLRNLRAILLKFARPT